MRIWQVLITSALVMFPMSQVQAAQPQQNFEVGVEISSFNYEEPNFMEEEGVLFGFFGNYDVLLRENSPHSSIKDLFSNGNGFNRFEIDARILWGEVDYTSPISGTLDDIDDWLFEIRGLTGYDFPLANDQLITFFLGLGFRYLNDDSGGLQTSTGAFGYERESNYFYLPIGLKYFVPFNERWSFEARGEFDVFLTGEQESHLEDVSSSLNTVTNDQDSGWGVRASVRLERKGENFDLFIEPYYRYWHVDDSEVSPVTFMGALVGFGLEPENNSWEAGSRIGIRF